MSRQTKQHRNFALLFLTAAVLLTSSITLWDKWTSENAIEVHMVEGRRHHGR